MTPKEFQEHVLPTLNVVYEMHDRPQPSAAAAGLWAETLKRFHPLTVCEAIKRWVAEPERHYGPPQPNDIARLIDGTPEERAALGWQKFVHAVRCLSPYRSVAFDDPILHAVVRHMGGWVKLVQTMDDQTLDGYRLEFEKSYRSLVAGGVPLDTPLRLLGVVEEDHARRGVPYHDEGTLQLWGNKTLAQQVAAGQHPDLPRREPTAAALAPVHVP
jgi:hypothetical protein